MPENRISKTARAVLSAKRVQTLKKPGLYADGGGLYLQIGPEGGKSWLYRFHMGRQRYMGLGPLVDVPLSKARELAAECRDKVRQGIDPIEERRQRRFEARLQASRSITFKECCEAYIATHAPSWRNEKHKAQWENTLSTYAYPAMGNLQVRDIDTDHVLKVLEPIWNEKRETARRLRARLERVLSWAATRKYRSSENPARWQGHLRDLLPRESTTAPVKHHPALPYDDVHNFMVELREQNNTAARALEFTILTATRTSEVVNATWAEFSGGEWTIPGTRMKSGRPHRVPLSKAAVAVLKRMEGQDDTYVFPGLKHGKPLSNMAMLNLLKRMDRKTITVHGFRSTFRDWAAEQTAYPNHVVEQALAHVIGDKVEAAYRRGDLLEKRKKMMADWSRYIDRKPGKVVQIRRAK
jgi:integrase